MQNRRDGRATGCSKPHGSDLPANAGAVTTLRRSAVSAVPRHLLRPSPALCGPLDQLGVARESEQRLPSTSKWAPQVSNLRPLPCEWEHGDSDGFTLARPASHSRDNTAPALAPRSALVAPVRPATTPHGPPVVRPLVRMLTVREVAEHLALSTATVYAMIERGELAHARVSNSIRIARAELKRYLTDGRGALEPPPYRRR